MWWVESVRSGLTSEGPEAPLAVFRVVFAAACLIKIVHELRGGTLRAYRIDSYLYFCHRVRRPVFVLSPHLYRAAFAATVVGAMLTLAGIAPRLGCALLGAGLVAEVLISPSNHTTLLILIAGVLAVGGSTCDGLSVPSLVHAEGDVTAWLRDAGTRRTPQIGQFLIVATMTVVYIATAVRKLNSTFLDGISVRAALAFARRERPRRGTLDGIVPGWFVRRFVEGDECVLARRWRPWTVAVVGLELALPAMLLVPHLALLAAVLGAGMHASFLVISPGRILPFSIVSVGTYLLFVDGRSVATALHWIAEVS